MINPFAAGMADQRPESVIGTCTSCDVGDVALTEDEGLTLCDECHRQGRTTGQTPNGTEYYPAELWKQIQSGEVVL